MENSSSREAQRAESGLSLLQGLAILGALGIVASIIFKMLAG